MHPFAPFSAAPIPAESLWERAALLEKPLADFATFLRDGQSTPAAESASSSIPENSPSRSAASVASLSVRTSPPGSDTSQQPAAASEPQAAYATPARAIEQAPAAASAESLPPTGSSGPPRFADVPDSAKYPAGPYRQAPPEYGGEWWLASPFTGEEPWVTQAATSASITSPVSKYATENLPQGFLQAFGEIPVRRGAEGGVEFAGRLSRWKQDLEFFQQTGVPEGLDEAQVELAANVYEQWGMGRPVFYEGRYGWFARFPDSAIPEFEMDAASAVGASHLAVARFQVRLLQQGTEVSTPHPFVPPHLLAQNA